MPLSARAEKPKFSPQHNRTRTPVQIEDGLVTVADDGHMRRTVIVGINHNPESAKPQDGRHT
jgi:hypothetical protein